jgi:hypothetical protein
MPSLGQTIAQAALNGGLAVAPGLLANQSLTKATGTINTGVGQAQQQLGTASQAAIDAQQRALAQQQGLYTTTTTANQPYQQTGLTGNSQLQQLIADPNSLTNTPGYQFELGQGLQGQQRQEAAQGTLGNGGTIKAATRYALDYANTKYNDAVQRLLQVTNVGQQANAANQRAADTFGSQIGNEASNVGNIGTRNAEDQASLTLAQAQLNAKNQTLQGNNTASTIQSLTPTIAGLAGKLLPNVFGGAAGTVAAAAPTIAGASAAGTSALGAAGAAAAPGGVLAGTGALDATGLAVAPSTAGIGAAEGGAATSGGIGSSALSTLSSLATNPITWGVAAAIGGALIWRSTQTHQTASTFTKNYQDPFGKHLGNVVDSFDQALASGQMTKQQAQAARDQTAQLIQQFEADGQKFAQKGDKEASVFNQAQRTMAEDFGGIVDKSGHGSMPDWSKILGKMDQEIAQLPAQAA